MSGIGINPDNLNERATALKIASDNFESQTLAPIDEESTITVNQTVQSVFEEAQEGHTLFSEAIRISSAEIKDIGDRFFTIDEQAASTIRIETDGSNGTMQME